MSECARAANQDNTMRDVAKWASKNYPLLLLHHTIQSSFTLLPMVAIWGDSPLDSAIVCESCPVKGEEEEKKGRGEKKTESGIIGDARKEGSEKKKERRECSVIGFPSVPPPFPLLLSPPLLLPRTLPFSRATKWNRLNVSHTQRRRWAHAF